MSVVPEKVGKAVALVILGGILAAFLGPELARLFRGFVEGALYAGSYLVYGCLCFGVALILFFFFKNPSEIESLQDKHSQRPLSELSKQPLLWVAIALAAVAYGTMSLVMTATPISMHHHHGIALPFTKMTIQWHVVFMFLPSFVSGYLLSKLGVKSLGVLGCLVLILSALLGVLSQSPVAYLFCLILLGIGWNFAFVCSTTLLTQTYVFSERFKVQSLNDGLVFGTQAILSLSAGLIIQHLGWVTLNFLSLLLNLVALGLLLFFLRSEQNVVQRRFK